LERQVGERLAALADHQAIGVAHDVVEFQARRIDGPNDADVLRIGAALGLTESVADWTLWLGWRLPVAK
jgi:hypothetical protein